MANITQWQCSLGGTDSRSWLPWQSFKAAKARTSLGLRPLEPRLSRGTTGTFDLNSCKRLGARIHANASSGRFRAKRVRRENSEQLFSSVLLPPHSKSKSCFSLLSRRSVSVASRPLQASPYRTSSPKRPSPIRIRTKRVGKPTISVSLACLPVEEDLGKWSINSTPRDSI